MIKIKGITYGWSALEMLPVAMAPKMSTRGDELLIASLDAKLIGL